MSSKPMRLVFGEMLRELGSEHKELLVADADVSSSTQTKLFADVYPDRFFNFGIAEANMVAAAAGMAASGYTPVVSTFAFLLTLRAGDIIRSLIAYNSLNVKLAGGYAGLSDFADGASHQSVLDIAVMRAMPNMTVLVPSDIETTRGAVRAMIEHQGPVYLRLSRDMVETYHSGNERVEFGHANVLREGDDVTLCVCGTPLKQTLEAADALAAMGIHAAVLEYVCVKPFDAETLVKYAAKSRAVVSIEEHNIIGGLGGAVAEALAENAPAPLCRIGLNDTFGESGPYSLLLDKHGITAVNIAAAAKRMVEAKKQN